MINKYKEVFIVEYGCGNFLSLRAWIKSMNMETWLIRHKSDFNLLTDESIIILPGVGHFKHAMSSLEAHDMVGSLASVRGRIPILGICLGAQLMFSGSEEAPGIAGLNWLNGECVRLPNSQLPRLGWYDNTIVDSLDESKEISLAVKKFFYFNHSYRMPLATCKNLTASAESEGSFTFFLSSERFAGVQFHPERSQGVGREFLRTLLSYWSNK